MRDVIANVTPELFNPRDLYAVPAIAGAGLTSLSRTLAGSPPRWASSPRCW
ncbi:TRIC cation channel family protein [Arthrobacter sp. JCM 19049]|uniref:TRIC cation channel family protein n=1 Tax=Arthrobacter sp. JCM 19049 TaxID=1460643 RepID=UPI000AF6D1B9|nr:TRIC cation channel family protein [Arthrobacter sp. JCM 19049]